MTSSKLQEPTLKGKNLFILKQVFPFQSSRFSTDSSFYEVLKIIPFNFVKMAGNHNH